VVEIHYEPGDQGSKDFFTSKLAPEHVNEIGQITPIPFGRSTYTDDKQECVNDKTETCEYYKEHVSFQIAFCQFNLNNLLVGLLD